MKLVPYHGVLVKEYVGEILKSFDKFQVVPSSMKVFTMLGCNTVGTGYNTSSWYKLSLHDDFNIKF